MSTLQFQLRLDQPQRQILVRPARLSNPEFSSAFWKRVNKWPGRGPHGDCWEWTGYIDRSRSGGYGVLACDGKSQRANRVCWQIVNGPIPDGMQVLHRCDHRPCVNPSHLFLGTNYENVQDKLRKGRHLRGLEAAMYSNPRRGSDNPHAKLTDEQVLAMREKYAQGQTCRDIAKQFAIREHVCNMILHGRRWAHLPGALPPQRRMARQHREEILRLRAQGLSLLEIGVKFGFSEAAICRITKASA